LLRQGLSGTKTGVERLFQHQTVVPRFCWHLNWRSRVFWHQDLVTLVTVSRRGGRLRFVTNVSTPVMKKQPQTFPKPRISNYFLVFHPSSPLWPWSQSLVRGPGPAWSQSLVPAPVPMTPGPSPMVPGPGPSRGRSKVPPRGTSFPYDTVLEEQVSILEEQVSLTPRTEVPPRGTSFPYGHIMVCPLGGRGPTFWAVWVVEPRGGLGRCSQWALPNYYACCAPYLHFVGE